MMFFKADDLVITGIHERSIADENSSYTAREVRVWKGIRSTVIKTKALNL